MKYVVYGFSILLGCRIVWTVANSPVAFEFMVKVNQTITPVVTAALLVVLIWTQLKEKGQNNGSE